jgi:hydrogenase-4 component B
MAVAMTLWGRSDAAGDAYPARLAVTLRCALLQAIYAPIGKAIWFATKKLNHVQVLTIRKFTCLVFGALMARLRTVAIWP